MIRLLALDVDGTLTDGGLYMDGSGNEFKRFDIQDGMGLVLLREHSVKVAFISGRFSGSTEQRARDLGIEMLYNGVSRKLELLKKIAREMGFSNEEVAFAGDDVNDMDCITWSGLGIAVANARPQVRECADMVTSAPGGYGAVREICEFIIDRNTRPYDKDRSGHA